eukprot:scaffold803_cov367-Pavlova_lutheri.AAC.6
MLERRTVHTPLPESSLVQLSRASGLVKYRSHCAGVPDRTGSTINALSGISRLRCRVAFPARPFPSSTADFVWPRGKDLPEHA